MDMTTSSDGQGDDRRDDEQGDGDEGTAGATRMGDRMSGRKQPQFSPRDTEKTDVEKLIRGYPFGTVASALQKEVRRGDLEGAVYWGLILYEASPQYAWKRVLVTAAEDIGFGDPEVVAKVCSMAAAWKVAKEGSWYVSPQLFTMAVVMLCRAQKSTVGGGPADVDSLAHADRQGERDRLAAARAARARRRSHGGRQGAGCDLGGMVRRSSYLVRDPGERVHETALGALSGVAPDETGAVIERGPEEER